jgi:hypothetical protein
VNSPAFQWKNVQSPGALFLAQARRKTASTSRSGKPERLSSSAHDQLRGERPAVGSRCSVNLEPLLRRLLDKGTEVTSTNPSPPEGRWTDPRESLSPPCAAIPWPY